MKYVPTRILSEFQTSVTYIEEVILRDYHQLLEQLDFDLPRALSSDGEHDSANPDLYEGWGGAVYALVRCQYLGQGLLPSNHKGMDKEKLWTLCNKLLKKNTAANTFYMGHVGALVTSMHVANLRSDHTAIRNLSLEFLKMADRVDNSTFKYHELLYGTTGFLIALLEAAALAGPEAHSHYNTRILHLCQHIIKTGEYNFAQLPGGKEPRLVFSFHGKEYLGAAHGLWGVLYVLLQAIDRLLGGVAFDEIAPLVNALGPSLWFCLGRQTPDGNFPSSAASSKADLVQFCHGAPGAVAPLLLAAKLTSRLPPSTHWPTGMQLRETAVRAGECIWEKGLLKKGWGLCHGISGNGYALLDLATFEDFSTAERQMWLQRGQQFYRAKTIPELIQQVEQYSFADRFVKGQADYPFSLMLGLAGDLCFGLDLRREKSAFPGYTSFNASTNL